MPALPPDFRPRAQRFWSSGPDYAWSAWLRVIPGPGGRGRSRRMGRAPHPPRWTSMLPSLPRCCCRSDTWPPARSSNRACRLPQSRKPNRAELPESYLGITWGLPESLRATRRAFRTSPGSRGAVPEVMSGEVMSAIEVHASQQVDRVVESPTRSVAGERVSEGLLLRAP